MEEYCRLVAEFTFGQPSSHPRPKQPTKAETKKTKKSFYSGSNDNKGQSINQRV